MDIETIKKYVANLPATLKGYFLRDTWTQKVTLISSTNKLTEEQAVAFKGEVFLVLIGMENYSDFKTNVRKNVLGINEQMVGSIVADTEKLIFEEIKPFLLEIEERNNLAPEGEPAETPNKETILDEIENPVPTKPLINKVANPAGTNIILDAQHNLPEQEKRVLISSSAVPSRGPMLGNFKSNFNVTPMQPINPVVEVVPVAPVAQPIVPVPAPTPIEQPIAPVSTPIPQPVVPDPAPIVTPPVQQPAQTPIPEAPAKYTVDPYREPLV